MVTLDDVPAKSATWLGVAVSETTAPLCAQLGLKRGEGLVVNLVSSNSPAAAIGLQENDVLVGLDDQMLVDPVQLRKLVQMHAEGDELTIEFYRAGKRESATATLTKMPAGATSVLPASSSDGRFRQRLQNVIATAPNMNTGEVNAQVRRAMAEAERALHEAFQQSQEEASNSVQRLTALRQALRQNYESLAASGVNLSNVGTVMVRNDTGGVRTIVKKDDSGTYILIADGGKHLTVHSPNGKLLFDGPVDTGQDWKKVPAAIWERAQSMVLEGEPATWTNNVTAPDGIELPAKNDIIR
jgi:membrane-associated protease RseP (regulator of RpoE activity)